MLLDAPISLRRTVVWLSTGAASAVAAFLVLKENPSALLVRCETDNEDEDNYRFESEVCAWLGRDVTVIKSTKYEDVPDVWTKRKFMAGRTGAPCTVEMKLAPRLAFQHPSDEHVFGYTADPHDVVRFNRMRSTFFEMTLRAPLIERGMTKAACTEMLGSAGIQIPRTYAMGFPNANCLQTGCVKATSPLYWSLFREKFPERFARTAEMSRKLGARLVRIKNVRRFLDELPEDHPTGKSTVEPCDFLCAGRGS